jgi:hypothetical protein
MIVLALLGPLAQKGRGDFVLLNDEQLTVNSYHYQGTLFDTSHVFIVPGGSVHTLGACNYSVVDISGGSILDLNAYNFSAVEISGGNVNTLDTYNSSTASISGGSITGLYPHDSSTVGISGGSITQLAAYDYSVVTLYGQNFCVGGGLAFDGERVLGTGILSGEWMDGTRWVVNILTNRLTATILAIPEPATLLLLGLGAVMVRKRCRPFGLKIGEVSICRPIKQAERGKK